VGSGLRIGLIAFGRGLGRTGGLQVFAGELAEALPRHAGPEHRFTLILGPDDPAPELPAHGRVSAVRLAWPGGRPEGAWARRLRRGLAALTPSLAPRGPFSAQIDALGLDLVHCPTTRAEDLDLRTPLVLTFFDMQEEFLPQLFSLRERLGRRAAHRASVSRSRMVIAPSEFTRRCLRARYRTPEARLRVVPVGISEAFSTRREPDEERRLRASCRLPEGPFALYPANPWPHKNHALLFRALGLVHELSGERIPLLCTGRLSGESRGVEEIARRVGLPQGQVTDLGYVEASDLPGLYRAARLLVFPSLFEGFGIPVLEAMAAGCPVACSATTSLPELGADAVRCFDPRSEAAIAAALQELWGDADRRAELSRRGLARAEAFRWERIVPRLIEAYAAALSGPWAGAACRS
jgi:glycosyltransferase involved in cell wall biosynthesis